MRDEDLGFTLTALVQSAHSVLDGLTERLIPRCAVGPCARRWTVCSKPSGDAKHVSQSQTSKYKKIPRALARLRSGVTQPRP